MKPLLLGMNNPLSDDPKYDLFPYPEGSTGYRLWKLLPEGTTRSQYLAAFDRCNLLRARVWNQAAAREAAVALLPDLLKRDYVIVLGTQVRAALGLSASEPLDCKWYQVNGVQHFAWVAFPHPSGRNHWFNNADNRVRAGDLLAKFMRNEVRPG